MDTNVAAQAIGLGHNQPPDPLLAEAQDRIETANRYLTERGDIDKWDADIADKANAFLGQVDGTFKALDERRKAENREWEAKQNGIYKNPLSLLTKAKEALAALRRKWLLKEEERVKEEKRKAEEAAEKARLEAEAAAKKAEKSKTPLEAQLAAEEAQQRAEQAAKVAESAPAKAQIKGTFSQRATGLRDHWYAEIDDFTLAFKHYKKREAVVQSIKDAVQSIATAEAKILKDESKAPPGVRFIKDRR